jgi:hypothetical protein
MKNTFLFLVAMAVFAAGSSRAQGQQSSASLGEVARAVKKTQAPEKAPAKVYDNDNLPADGKLSVVGTAPAQDATTADASPNPDPSKDENSEAPAKADDSLKPGQTPEEREKALAAWKAKFADQKDKINLLSRELDILQGEYKLKQREFYADAARRTQNPNALFGDDAKYTKQIADKQKGLDTAKAKLDSMQEEARKSGVPTAAAE